MLVVVYLLALTLIVALVTVVIGVLMRMYADPYAQGALIANGDYMFWLAANGRLLAGIAAVTAALILLASLYRIATLSRGGGQVARMLGGTEITGETQDPLRRRLINVVEEMSIASGVPVPEVYVLEQEQGINAFAAGLTPSNAAVAVTRGALERLNRAELQGVIAHEFSHVLNGDMRLNLRLMGLSFGILVLSLIGRWLLRSARFSRRDRSGGTSAAIVLGLALTLIGFLGLFFARIIKAGVSRQREVLADASAVQFTRNPTGLAEALKKIAGYTGQLASTDSEEVAHMLFSRGSRAFRGWFATHPPLDERILALDPTFTPGRYPEPAEPIPLVEDVAAEVLVPSLAAGSDSAVAEGGILTQAGQSASWGLATALRVAIPEELHQAAHSPDASLLLILALALGQDRSIRKRQLELLNLRLGDLRAVRCERLAEELDRTGDRLRLPLVEIALPALKQRPPEQLQFLADLLQRLWDINPKTRLFDYVLLKMLESYVWDLPESGLTPPKAARSLDTSTALVVLLRVVAAFGHRDGSSALAAFRAGIAAVGPKGARIPEPSFESMEDVRNLSALDAALARLARLRPRAKRRALAAVLACIRHDRRLDVTELELFRAIAATLGCPVPPADSIGTEV